ncbi:MAG: glycerophosphodiester phosphodiesterase family protein [Tannerella sp.]|jgi:glycerophosphoryl diester phosphodiesterase|nr:glycerophosphodiester phosphodiesterase family protein [Tannerella sp.]
MINSILIAFLTCTLHGQPDSNTNYLSFSDHEALFHYYRYDKNSAPIVQGHRGTREDGLPENSIAAMEHVLKHFPAVFEIDPRLTKDSVIVVFHDDRLERTSTGTGRVIDYTWRELQQLHLKNAKGEITEYKINTLAEALEWARGKTVLVLDKKDVPLKMIADIIRKYNANNYVINMVRSTEDALFYYRDDPRRMFSVSIRKPEVFYEYMKAGIPKTQMFACIGVEINDDTENLCRLMRENGIRCLMAMAPVYDRLKTPDERAQAYRKVVGMGVTMLESDYPIATGVAIKGER